LCALLHSARSGNSEDIDAPPEEDIPLPVDGRGIGSTLVFMSVNIELPPATLRRLEAEAARRGVGIDVVIAELAEALPAEDADEAPIRRRKLAIAGIGSSGGQRGRAADADELLADGFGRS
jgi:hypothetical protein